MRKQFNRNNRALSTVISTILMIMVVMIGMTLLFAYVTVYADNYKAGAGGAVLESLTIEDVWVRQNPLGGNMVTFWVYNTGKVDSTIVSVYNQNGVALTNSTGVVNIDTHVNVNQHIKITLNCASLSSVDIKIVTLRGSDFESR
jgi:FlaG/FlaF family flagellin (archaellin)